MEIFYVILSFIIGTIFGSFYNVVGYRLPKNESIVFPASHCPSCNHKLGTLELIPVFSYIFQKGKCRNCKQKISMFYPIFEMFTGIVFLLCYLTFGLSTDIIIPLTFASMLIIIMISDYNYMIINDSVLLIFGILLILEVMAIYGPIVFLKHVLAAVLAFFTMWGLKKLGDFLFKRESMGGGDIKLMGIVGFVLGYPMALLSIFIGSIIALPISLITIKKNSDHIIPFGPFLALAAIIIILSKLDFNVIANILN